MKKEFPKTIDEAKKYKEHIANNVILDDVSGEIKHICGLDVAYKEGKAFAAGVVYDIEEKRILEVKTANEKTRFPYVPTFLFMREVPILLSVLSSLKSNVDLCLVDGHGIAHPQNAGSASVLGVIAKIPSIGVAKKPLRYFEYSPTQETNIDVILLKNIKVGYRYRFERKWNPLFISPGNMISHESSLTITRNLLSLKYKLPLPLHEAHTRAGKSKNFS